MLSREAKIFKTNKQISEPENGSLFLSVYHTEKFKSSEKHHFPY
jgi:hypothetical protein